MSCAMRSLYIEIHSMRQLMGVVELFRFIDTTKWSKNKKIQELQWSDDWNVQSPTKRSHQIYASLMTKNKNVIYKPVLCDTMPSWNVTWNHLNWLQLCYTINRCITLCSRYKFWKKEWNLLTPSVKQKINRKMSFVYDFIIIFFFWFIFCFFLNSFRLKFRWKFSYKFDLLYELIDDWTWMNSNVM